MGLESGEGKPDRKTRSGTKHIGKVTPERAAAALPTINVRQIGRAALQAQGTRHVRDVPLGLAPVRGHSNAGLHLDGVREMDPVMARERNGQYARTLKGRIAPAAPGAAFRPTANPVYAAAIQELRRSGAAGTHEDRRSRRARTRQGSLKKDLRDQAE